jgi:hypothetical protein
MNYSSVKKIIFSTVIIFFFVFVTELSHAQVNVNSKTSEDDESYYELSDTEIIIEEIDVNVDDGEGTITNVTRTTYLGDSILNDAINDVENIVLSSNNVPDVLKNFIKEEGIATAASIGVSLSFIPLALSVLPLLLSPQSLLAILGSIFGKKRKVIGIVFDEETKKTLPLAVVRVYRSNSTALVTQKVTDLEGRYGFVLSSGSYRLEASQSGYDKYTQEFIIDDPSERFAADIGLRRNGKIIASGPKFLRWIRRITLKYSIYLSFIGLIMSITAFLIVQDRIQIALIIYYSTIILIYFWLKKRKSQKWGEVIDSSSGIRIAGAIVRIFDKKNSLSDTQMTDEQGRFSFYVDPGDYYLYVNASGYSFPSTNEKGELEESEGEKMLRININKSKWLSITALVDPMEYTASPIKNLSDAQNQSVQASLNKVHTGSTLSTSPFS